VKALICDGSYMLHRVYHTTGWDLSDGEIPTGGCYGVLKSLHTALDRLSGITSAYVVWDGSKSARRKQLYPEYKGNRKEKDVDFRDTFNLQRTLLSEVLPHLGVHSVLLPDREGDDTVFWMSRFAGEAVILSDDKDMLTMLAPTVDVYRPFKDEHWTWDAFSEEWGFDPSHYVTYKAIVGDASDNIKGVQGAGEKTALEFVRSYARSGSLVEASGSTNRRMRAIAEQWPTVQRNVQLMDVREEVLSADELAYLLRYFTAEYTLGLNEEAFKEFCLKYKFVSMLSDTWAVPFRRMVGRV
jgi:DNA polymerase I